MEEAAEPVLRAAIAVMADASGLRVNLAFTLDSRLALDGYHEGQGTERHDPQFGTPGYRAGRAASSKSSFAALTAIQILDRFRDPVR